MFLFSDDELKNVFLFWGTFQIFLWYFEFILIVLEHSCNFMCFILLSLLEKHANPPPTPQQNTLWLKPKRCEYFCKALWVERSKQRGRGCWTDWPSGPVSRQLDMFQEQQTWSKRSERGSLLRPAARYTGSVIRGARHECHREQAGRTEINVLLSKLMRLMWIWQPLHGRSAWKTRRERERDSQRTETCGSVTHKRVNGGF